MFFSATVISSVKWRFHSLPKSLAQMYRTRIGCSLPIQFMDVFNWQMADHFYKLLIFS